MSNISLHSDDASLVSRTFNSGQSPLSVAKPQVRRAYRELVSLIHSRKLENGSVLPAHEELRRQIRCGSNVLDEAMQLLVDDGVIERSRSHGTTVRELNRVAAHTWSIAVIALDEPEYALKPMAEHYLRRSLLERGCADRTYLTSPTARKKQDRHALSDCVALQEDVQQGKVDGIISLIRMQDCSVPVCHVLTSPVDGPYLTFDTGGFVVDATELMISKRCRRLGLMITHFSNNCETGLAAANKMLDRERLPDLQIYNAQPRAWEGQRLAEQILALPPTKRPQGLIITDDHLASGVTAALRADISYQPQIAVMANLQLPMPMALPVHRFVVDIRELADRAVEMLLGVMLKRADAPEQFLLRPKLMTHDA